MTAIRDPQPAPVRGNLHRVRFPRYAPDDATTWTSRLKTLPAMKEYLSASQTHSYFRSRELLGMVWTHPQLLGIPCEAQRSRFDASPGPALLSATRSHEGQVLLAKGHAPHEVPTYLKYLPHGRIISTSRLDTHPTGVSNDRTSERLRSHETTQNTGRSSTRPLRPPLVPKVRIAEQPCATIQSTSH